MERWHKQLAIVVGASSGIGADIAKTLVKAGMVVAGLARRKNKIEELREELPEKLRRNLHAYYCDVTSNDSITAAFDEIDKNLGHIHVLVYSAGILKHHDAIKNELSDMELVMQTNFMGAVRCTMLAHKIMEANNIDGHLVYINSALINFIPVVSGLNVYPSSKHALNAFIQVLRNEFGRAKIKIKTTSINPGMVHTDLPADLSEALYKIFPYMEVSDVSQAVIYALSTPPHMNVADVFLKPLGEFFTPEYRTNSG